MSVLREKAYDEKIYTIEELEYKLKSFAAKHKIKYIFLFGSYAKGKAIPESDIDIIIDRGDIKNLIDLWKAKEEIECLFEKKVDLLLHDEIDENFLEKIRKGLKRIC